MSRPNISFNTQRLSLTLTANRYYIWLDEPDWLQGVVVLSKPFTGSSVVADASIMPLGITGIAPEYAEVIPTVNRNILYNNTIDSAFKHLRLQETGAAGSEFWVSSTGVLVEADPATGKAK